MKISVLFLVSYFTIVYSDGMKFSDEKNEYQSVARLRAKRDSLSFYKGKFIDTSCELSLNLGGGVGGGSAVGGAAGAGAGAAIG